MVTGIACSWQVEAGVPLFPIAQAMGHKDIRMLERVYSRQTPEQHPLDGAHRRR